MIAAAFLLACAAPFTSPSERPDTYRQTIEQWRAEYATGLQKPEGWLSVAGLFWLKEGVNTLGSDASSNVVLPAHSSPARAGTLTRSGDHVVLDVASGVNLLVNEAPSTHAELKSDMSGRADRMRLGDVTFKVIQRGNRIGVRLYDPKCKGRLDFKGLHWYAVDPALVVRAKFVRYDPPKPVPIFNILGDLSPTSLPGYLEFTINGTECRLDAEDAGSGLFLNFQDETTGETTYGAGRFLDVDRPLRGEVTIDFNKATNPPCAYTGFATCPLPPPGNSLDVRIEAGEKAYHAE
ncbi:MAG: uncharacterized protein QOJ65_79 [Fimbriimonadaceae bacterium]|jgi:uncharacterized protein (DUF1684 family)|nr:uncharacterized protein [Fimbriimonadaceae bacterium]